MFFSLLWPIGLFAQGTAPAAVAPAALGVELSGRVLDPDGAPVYPLVVGALSPEFLTSTLTERAWNELYDSTFGVTDREGRFALRGLAPGRYALVGALDGVPERLDDELHAPGELDVQLTAPVRRLRVRVLESDGTPVDLSRLRKARISDWDHYHGCALLAHVPLGATRDRALLHFPDEVIRPVESGDRIRLAYADFRHVLAEQELAVPGQPWLVTTEIRLAPPAAPARVRIRLTADGMPYRGRAALRVSTRAGPDVLVHSGVGDVLEFALAPGGYRLRVQDEHWSLCWQGDPEDLVAELAFVETELELAPGEAGALELELPPNCRLRVKLAGEARGTEQEIAAGLESQDWSATLREPLRGARIELLPLAGGRPIETEFSVAVPGAEAGKLRAPWAAPGRECVTISALPPGSYLVRAFLADGRVLERPITLVFGPTNVVELGP
jgi:hypothetical protein